MFSANNKITVNGMSVSTKVKGNMLIATDNTSDNNYSSEDLFSSTSSGILEPVSSVNGIDFFYTKDKVTGTGETTDASLETYSTQSAFATYYDVTGADAYKDYVFYLKATSDSANQKVVISKFNMLYDGAALGSEKAWRAAVFAQTVNEGAAGVALASGQLKTIVAPTSATYFSAGNAYSTASGKAAVNQLSQPANIGTIVNAGTTQRYYVVVRLFLEGEDNTCKNDTFATLTEEWSLNLTCQLVDSATDGAAVISSQAAAVVTNTNLVANVAKATDGLNEDIISRQWQKKDNNGVYQDIDSATETSYTGTAGDVVRCKVTIASGIYYSNSVTLVAA